MQMNNTFFPFNCDQFDLKDGLQLTKTNLMDFFLFFFIYKYQIDVIFIISVINKLLIGFTIS